MRMTLLTSFCFMAVAVTDASAANTITYYRDGTLFRQEAVAVKGVIEIPLAADLLEQTLTVKPAPGTSILSVETKNNGSGGKTDKTLEVLTEQRRRLEDRLQALETREAIFTAAAKSQSGKAPRKTKANPDPLKSIRQGTDFAIAQLEAVYTARRTTRQEMRKIDLRIAAAKKGSRTAESSVRIEVTPARGKVMLSYATTEQGWQPLYNLYLTGEGPAKLQLYARITGSQRGFQGRVSPGSLVESATAATFTVQSATTVLASYRLPITDVQYREGIFKHFSGTITNSTQNYLPTGESALFRNEVYLGKFRFEGISSGRSGVISFGK